ncbi:pyrroline-5-carboxylate reductase [Oscillatoriales cyanobacterium LEGE 11467]|uniref:Pyrroline-5-carboxylate reductase n=1 Tax=Zarconia navalis LEGE 11467 TaxID=1828826 RepID=A0A928Z7B7_9CYAN|nr:pyrroline-5-carboxylate reductase [Zarconia navalis]MBE9040375.1 pyrroline-5-carboxylate reductase [Zarconia navalis LEGE 11467]
MTHCKLGIIGGGVMGEALLSRLLAEKVYQPHEVWVVELQPDRARHLEQQYGVRTLSDSGEAIAAANVLLLAIKPQVFDAIAERLRDEATDIEEDKPLILSIMAGVPLGKLQGVFPGRPIVRAMPNTPATVGAGIAAMASGQFVVPQHRSRAKLILEAVGEVVEVPESLMDAVTGLSGSGPGYVAVFIEALIDGGVAVGLPRAIATQLAIQTVRGTAQLLNESGMHPAQLKDSVTSPGGTTIAGIACLERSGLRSASIEAVRAACARAKELGA